jgi:hypothetical protein
MDQDKLRQEVSLIGKILSLEALLLLMGLASLLYGIANARLMNIILGAALIPGVLLLFRVRRKDRK